MTVVFRSKQLATSDVLLLDKTAPSLIVYRRRPKFRPAPGVTKQEVGRKRCAASKPLWPTNPEGAASLVVSSPKNSDSRERASTELPQCHLLFPFKRQTRMSGVESGGGGGGGGGKTSVTGKVQARCDCGFCGLEKFHRNRYRPVLKEKFSQLAGKRRCWSRDELKSGSERSISRTCSKEDLADRFEPLSGNGNFVRWMITGDNPAYWPLRSAKESGCG